MNIFKVFHAISRRAKRILSSFLAFNDLSVAEIKVCPKKCIALSFFKLDCRKIHLVCFFIDWKRIIVLFICTPDCPVCIFSVHLPLIRLCNSWVAYISHGDLSHSSAKDMSLITLYPVHFVLCAVRCAVRAVCCVLCAVRFALFTVRKVRCALCAVRMVCFVWAQRSVCFCASALCSVRCALMRCALCAVRIVCFVWAQRSVQHTHSHIISRVGLRQSNDAYKFGYTCCNFRL